MPTYRVTWEIDVEAADPRAAVRQAEELRDGPGSTATVYAVRRWLTGGGVLDFPIQVDTAWRRPMSRRSPTTKSEERRET